MQARTFAGSLTIRIDEYENNVTVLVLANSVDQAYQVLKDGAASYYGSDPESNADEIGGYYACGGEVYVYPNTHALREIGLQTYLEMRPYALTYCAENVQAPTPEMHGPELQAGAKALHRALVARGLKDARASDVLEALAATFGARKWQVLKDRLSDVKSATSAIDKVIDAFQDLEGTYDNTGCTDDLAVVGSMEYSRLEDAVEELKDKRVR